MVCAAVVGSSARAPVAQDLHLLDPLGAAFWRVRGEGRGLPAADASSVFFLTKRHEVLAVNAHSGEVRWRRHTQASTDATEGNRLTLAGPVVVAGDYALVAFDRVTGDRRWKFDPLDGGYDVGSFLGPAAGGLVYAGGRGGRLYALEEESGQVRWSTVVHHGSALSTVFEPVLSDDLLVASYTTFTAPNGGGVIALEANTGRIRWQTSYQRPANPATHVNAGGTPVVSGHLVIATRGDGVIHAFDRDTGALVWTIPKLEPTGFLPLAQDSRPLALAGRLLVAGSVSGVVTAYDLASRREQWRYTGSSGSVAFALVADERSVYVPHVGGRLIALATPTGAERWRVGDNSFGFVWPPIVFEDRLYVSGAGAGFYALRW